MKKVALIALDLDGTLLDDQKNIHAENVEALAEARRRGVKVAISSGRMTPRIEPIEDLLGLDCVIIAYNGAKVLGTRAEGRPTIHHQPLGADVAGVFIEFARESGHLLNFYHEDRLYAESGSNRQRFMDLYSRRTGAEYSIADLSRFRDVEPTKLILLADPEERDRLYERFCGELGDRASISKSDPEYLEVMDRGVSKGAALAAIAATAGITPEEILAVGDADNDASMIAAAGIGVAVANARDGVKSIADFVTERTNNEGAVAEAVQRFVLC